MPGLRLRMLLNLIRSTSLTRRSRQRRPLPELLEGRCLMATFNVYSLPKADPAPSSITSGPDGNLWFTEPNVLGDQVNIGKISPSGSITDYPLPAGVSLGQITSGSDGNLWFGESSKIGSLSTSGQLGQSFPIPNSGIIGNVHGITKGPDGNVWFIIGGSFIGKITPTGQVTEFPLKVGPSGNIVSADGSLWFTYGVGQGNLGIAKFTTTGQITTYRIPTPPTGQSGEGSEFYGITADAQGNLWCY